LVEREECRALLCELDAWLQRRLEAMGDEFRPGMEYIRQWEYSVDESGTVPYCD
jgi:hypothetical protein